jgi:hypothetical protein
MSYKSNNQETDDHCIPNFEKLKYVKVGDETTLANTIKNIMANTTIDSKKKPKTSKKYKKVIKKKHNESSSDADNDTPPLSKKSDHDDDSTIVDDDNVYNFSKTMKNISGAGMISGMYSDMLNPNSINSLGMNSIGPSLFYEPQLDDAPHNKQKFSDSMKKIFKQYPTHFIEGVNVIHKKQNVDQKYKLPESFSNLNIDVCKIGDKVFNEDNIIKDTIMFSDNGMVNDEEHVFEPQGLFGGHNKVIPNVFNYIVMPVDFGTINKKKTVMINLSELGKHFNADILSRACLLFSKKPEIEKIYFMCDNVCVDSISGDFIDILCLGDEKAFPNQYVMTLPFFFKHLNCGLAVKKHNKNYKIFIKFKNMVHDTRLQLYSELYFLNKLEQQKQHINDHIIFTQYGGFELAIKPKINNNNTSIPIQFTGDIVEIYILFVPHDDSIIIDPICVLKKNGNSVYLLDKNINTINLSKRQNCTKNLCLINYALEDIHNQSHKVCGKITVDNNLVLDIDFKKNTYDDLEDLEIKIFVSNYKSFNPGSLITMS